MKKSELIILLVILATASFFRLSQLTTIPPGLYPDEAMDGNNALQALDTGRFEVFYPANNGVEGLFANVEAVSIRFFGNTAFALRLVAALSGILTVLGLYFLVRQMMNWQIAAISSFLMAVSFWHVLFSRIGFRAIMAPLFMVWGLYFFWKGLSSGRFGNFAASGLMWGLGLYTYIAFRAMPLAIILTIAAYWHAIKKDFAHVHYEHARNQLLRGLALLMLVAIFVGLPLGYYFYTHPADFSGRTGQISIFSSEHPVKDLAGNIVKTLGMFTSKGDGNWRHNYAGDPELFWPIGAMFLVGLIKSIVKLVKNYKKHEHFSPVQTALLSWFFVGLLPVVFSNEGIPHALRAILVAPVVFIFAGEGLWWLFETLERWYHLRNVHERDVHAPFLHTIHLKESSLVIGAVLITFLFSIGFVEYDAYFRRWAHNPNVAGAFSQNYADIAARLNALPQSKIKYVYVNAGGVLVNGIPMPAQTVMYLTDTATPAKQRAKNIYYLTEEQYQQRQFLRNSIIIPLEK